MRKYALPLTVASVVAGVFGAFLRWLQTMTIFEEETGLARPWAGISVAFAVFSLAVLAAMLGAALFLRRFARPTEAPRALKCTTGAPGAISWILGAAFVAGALAHMFTAGAASLPMLQRYFGAAGVIAGVCFPCLPGRRDGGVSSMGRAASAFLSLFFCFWLICCYLQNSQDPVLWHYLPAILAVAASTMAFYHVSGYHFGKGSPTAALFFLQAAIYLDICTIADSHSIWLKVMYAAAAAMLVMLEYLLIANMEEAPQEAA